MKKFVKILVAILAVVVIAIPFAGCDLLDRIFGGGDCEGCTDGCNDCIISMPGYPILCECRNGFLGECDECENSCDNWILDLITNPPQNPAEFAVAVTALENDSWVILSAFCNYFLSVVRVSTESDGVIVVDGDDDPLVDFDPNTIIIYEWLEIWYMSSEADATEVYNGAMVYLSIDAEYFDDYVYEIRRNDTIVSFWSKATDTIQAFLDRTIQPDCECGNRCVDECENWNDIDIFCVLNNPSINPATTLARLLAFEANDWVITDFITEEEHYNYISAVRISVDGNFFNWFDLAVDFFESFDPDTIVVNDAATIMYFENATDALKMYNQLQKEIAPGVEQAERIGVFFDFEIRINGTIVSYWYVVGGPIGLVII